mgnify:CR=1 FL=1
MPQDGPKSLPKTPPRPPKTLSRRLQDWLRPAQDRPWTPQDPPRPPQDRPSHPKKAQGHPISVKVPPYEPPRPPQEPPEVLINWRGGTKAQPSSIRRHSAERRARRHAQPNFWPQSILPSIFVLQTRLSSKLLAT